MNQINLRISIHQQIKNSGDNVNVTIIYDNSIVPISVVIGTPSFYVPLLSSNFKYYVYNNQSSLLCSGSISDIQPGYHTLTVNSDCYINLSDDTKLNTHDGFNRTKLIKCKQISSKISICK